MLRLVLNIRPHISGCLTNESPVAEHISGNQSDDDEWEDEDNLSDNDINIGQGAPRYLDVNKIVVIASTGIFKRSVQWCKCPNALDNFHLDALECNTSALNFMSKLALHTHPI